MCPRILPTRLNPLQVHEQSRRHHFLQMSWCPWSRKIRPCSMKDIYWKSRISWFRLPWIGSKISSLNSRTTFDFINKNNSELFMLKKMIFSYKKHTPNIRNIEEKHRESFQSTSWSPSNFIFMSSKILHDFFPENPTSKHLYPIAIKVDFHLKRRLCEWEIRRDPSVLDIFTKYIPYKAFICLLQILHN